LACRFKAERPKTSMWHISAAIEVTNDRIIECGKETSIKVNDAIKCDKCGSRILYKKRRTDKN
jgi:DNA-directed RNA polymerase subunit RPC12/RpoP